MKEIKWGMIGCGDVTEIKSGPAFSKIEHSKLIAVMSRTESRVKDYASRHNIPNWYTEAEKLINNPKVNAIYIATPPDSHEYYTRLVSEAGKPVYVEKPMARNYEECISMIDVCKRNNTPLFVAYYRRKLPKFVKVKELIDTGEIGEIMTVTMQLFLPPRKEDLGKENPPWRVIPEIAGGGYFVDLATHQFDLLDYFFGPVKEVNGFTANNSDLYPAEDTVTTNFSFGNGVIGNGAWCFVVNEKDSFDEIKVIGTKGSLTFSTFDDSPVVMKNENGVKEFSLPFPEHVHQPLVESVVGELLGKDDCPSTGKSAARTNWVIDKVYGRI